LIAKAWLDRRQLGQRDGRLVQILVERSSPDGSGPNPSILGGSASPV
jgi:hypothetical protein